jgi:hypothetical protein
LRQQQQQQQQQQECEVLNKVRPDGPVGPMHMLVRDVHLDAGCQAKLTLPQHASPSPVVAASPPPSLAPDTSPKPQIYSAVYLVATDAVILGNDAFTLPTEPTQAIYCANSSQVAVPPPSPHLI